MKRLFDFIASLFGIIVFSPLLLFISIILILLEGFPIIFTQNRVGRYGNMFTVLKFRTMVIGSEYMPEGSVTTGCDKRITRIGKFLRKWKLDELPTLFNVMKGDMSFVGPRPEVPGYADKLEGNEQRLLKMRPGITGPATLKYSNEEELLAQVDMPQKYNDEVIFPDKVKINLEYMDNRNLMKDINIIIKTIFRGNY